MQTSQYPLLKMFNVLMNTTMKTVKNGKEHYFTFFRMTYKVYLSIDHGGTPKQAIIYMPKSIT